MSYDVYVYSLSAIIILFCLLIYIINNSNKRTNMYSSTTKNMSELSFQRYAKFLKETVIHDDMFSYKINKIINCYS